MKLTSEQFAQFDRDGYLFFPSLFTPEEIAVLTEEVPRALRAAPSGERARKDSDAVRTNFAAHMYSRPFAKLARHPRMVEPIGQLFGEDAVHAPVQDQRQDGVRRRRLAMAPGLRHLEERRPDARAARHERGDLSGRGERVQRTADVHSRQPQARRARRAARHSRPPAIRCGPSTTTRSANWSSAAASSRRRGRRDR